MLSSDTNATRKARGAFFTPTPIARYLARWAVGGDRHAKVLDPTCGEAVFLLETARELVKLGQASSDLTEQVYGVDLHNESLLSARGLLQSVNLDARMFEADFFNVPSPDQLGATLPFMDAVVGNPPFVRYQQHTGSARRRSAAAALQQGVRLSGLASSWAALLVHAAGFLKPEGRLAMVVPAELLTVGYAEPIRRWLRQRFAAVHLVLFEELQFENVEEQVVLLVARGSGGCNAFTLHQMRDADELATAHIFDAEAVTPKLEGKWTDLLLPEQGRGLFQQITGEHFVPLEEYASVELGTVTGANGFFTLSETTRREYGLIDQKHVIPTAPPGTRHLKGLTFTRGHWEQLRLQGERVWMLDPSVSRPTGGFAKYVTLGEQLKVPEAYKCSIRTPWWRPPVVTNPRFFFTYMSHHFPRLIDNGADTTLVNSMHAVHLRADAHPAAISGLPYLALNSVTALGAEICGRSYGGGILKMEPREAAKLPLPGSAALSAAWRTLSKMRIHLDELVRAGQWQAAVAEVDEALLTRTLKLSAKDVSTVRMAVSKLRSRRQRRNDNGAE